MKKHFTIIAILGILMLGLSASAKPMGGPGGHGGPHGMGGFHHGGKPPMMHPHVMPPMHPHITPHYRHRIGCPMYRGFGHRCTCYRHYGNGIYIDFRLPIIF